MLCFIIAPLESQKLGEVKTVLSLKKPVQFLFFFVYSAYLEYSLNVASLCSPRSFPLSVFNKYQCIFCGLFTLKIQNEHQIWNWRQSSYRNAFHGKLTLFFLPKMNKKKWRYFIKMTFHCDDETGILAAHYFSTIFSVEQTLVVIKLL